MEHSKCTSGADVMGRLNRRDDTPGRAVAPFVFASALGATEPSGDEAADAARRDNPFTWYGRTPASTALTTPQVWLDVQVFNDVDGGLYFNWDSHAELFPPGLIHTMFDAFSSLLERLACDAPRALNEREMKPHLLMQVELVQRRVERAAQRTPGRTAVAEEEAVGGADGARRPRRPVALVMDKGWAQVVGVLAAQLAGCAYVPLSVHQPASRMASILQDVE